MRSLVASRGLVRQTVLFRLLRALVRFVLVYRSSTDRAAARRQRSETAAGALSRRPESRHAFDKRHRPHTQPHHGRRQRHLATTLSNRQRGGGGADVVVGRPCYDLRALPPAAVGRAGDERFLLRDVAV